MEFLLFFLGGLVSWLISHLYYRQSSKKAPEWAVPLIDKLPTTLPTETQLLTLVKEHLHQSPLKEKGLNANGEYLRYTNGTQICQGKFTAGPESRNKEIQVAFPAQFFGDPSVEISGEVSKIISKRAKDSALLITVNPSPAEKLEFSYKATGNWLDPSSLA
ncbi:hypothetical protein D7241_14950 [Stutzerimonas sp. VN223-3]|uniref:hypothetical protein n=1 Tax=Stutzerimonas sp. VN223-3 TaxID=3384601 RepID=UPI0038B50F5C